MITPTALSWIFSAASSYSYDLACSWRKSGNSSQYKRLIYPKWELQPINSYAWRAAPRSSSAPASLGHARALWDGFSVEVDGGGNRRGWPRGRRRRAGVVEGQEECTTADCTKKPRRNRPIEMQDLPPSSSNCCDDCGVRNAKRWEVCADRVGDIAWREVGVELVRHGRKLSGRCRGRCSPSCRTSARACESRRR